jgi:hypothetical protein
MESLKAKAYDALAQIEYWQKELQRLNSEIAKLVTQEPAEAKTE